MSKIKKNDRMSRPNQNNVEKPRLDLVLAAARAHFETLSIEPTSGPATSCSTTTWLRSDAERFMTDVQKKLALYVNHRIDEERVKNVIKFLTNDFTPHPDLRDGKKNAVLWDTAWFIENVLTDWGMNSYYGLFVNQIRFANNDVKNLRDHRKEAMMLFCNVREGLGAQPNRPIRSKPRAAGQRKVAFLYIVASELGFAKRSTTTAAPHLLLIGHTAHRPRHWGIPGGLVDHSDRDSLRAAMREMGEELLGRKGITKSDVETLITKANDVGKLTKLTQTADKSYTAWLLKVDTAKKFERAFAELYKRTIVEKYDKRLSNETMGYLWIPLSAVQNARNNTIAAPIELGSRPLVLRRYVQDTAKRIV